MFFGYTVSAKQRTRMFRAFAPWTTTSMLVHWSCRAHRISPCGGTKRKNTMEMHKSGQIHMSFFLCSLFFGVVGNRSHSISGQEESLRSTADTNIISNWMNETSVITTNSYAVSLFSVFLFGTHFFLWHIGLGMWASTIRISPFLPAVEKRKVYGNLY